MNMGSLSLEINMLELLCLLYYRKKTPTEIDAYIYNILIVIHVFNAQITC